MLKIIPIHDCNIKKIKNIRLQTGCIAIGHSNNTNLSQLFSPGMILARPWSGV